MRKEAENWWQEALEELNVAERNLEIGMFSVTAFYSYQSVERALKALYIVKMRKTPPRAHNLFELGNELKLPDKILDKCKTLNKEYTVSRYPDAVYGIPSKLYTKEYTKSILGDAERVIDWIRKLLKK
jgi:HEPN domain-containing protein